MFDLLRHKGADRTSLNALTARNAHGFFEWFVAKSAHLQVITPVGHLNGINPHYFTACPNADTALDTLVGVEIKKRVALIDGQLLGHTIQSVETIFVKPNAIDERL
jgi:hypothetical protein